MNINKLKKLNPCEIRLDELSCSIYSFDASIFEVKPAGVALPRSQEELTQLVKFADQLAIPLIPRGAATGITGGCLGTGLVVDTSKYLNQILEFDSEKRIVKCEPGVVQDDLNRYLAPYNLRLGPDTSTGPQATIGGMVANHAAGARSLVYGTMIDAVLEIELLLSSGKIIHLKPLSESEWHQKLQLSSQEGDLYRAAAKIRLEDYEAIKKAYPPLPRRASGYPLDKLIAPFPLNLAKLIVGSEGTLGFIRSVTLTVVPLINETKVLILGFNSIQSAMEAVDPLLKLHPLSLELIDEKIISAGRLSPSLKGKLEWFKETPKALLILETREEVTLPALKEITFTEKLTNAQKIKHLYELRKAGLGLLLSKRSYTRAVAFIEDLSIPPHSLAPFMQKFLQLLKEHGKEAGIYGHAGSGCLHIRPYMNLRDVNDVELMKHLMLEVLKLIKEFKGAMSGEHGDGLIRSWLNPELFGEPIYKAFIELKYAFDPKGLMNPHKIIHPLPIDFHLRNVKLDEPKTFLKFDGGLALSADLCNGNGACRKKEGVMCPSFQVTHDEFDTTRARAKTFQDVLKVTKKGSLSNPELHEILDLCIQCKGCKKECPSQVDMAKMKSEALFHYQNEYGYSLRNWLFASLDLISQAMFPLKKLFNFFSNASFLKLFGIAGPLPTFAKNRFSELFSQIKQPKGTAVVLIIDTYSEFYCPEIAVSAVKVLNRLGFEVIAPPWQCCGRPALSKGFLEKAKKSAEELIKPLIGNNYPIIGLEPSCLLTFLDEFKELNPNPSQWMLFDTFLANNLKNIALKTPKKVALHGHCHQKAIVGMQDTLKALSFFSNLTAVEIPSGCCGMAGSFGHELEHRDFSKQIGELVLLPFVRELSKETAIISNGFSCRSQIERYTDRKAIHLAEWIHALFEDQFPE